MNNHSYNPFTIAQAQFDKVAGMLDLDSGTKALLRNTQIEYNFSILVCIENGDVQVFRGFPVVHNDARGPAKGGIRFHPQETIDTVCALAKKKNLTLRDAAYMIAIDRVAQASRSRGWV